MRTKTAFLFLCVFAGGIERERERERESTNAVPPHLRRDVSPISNWTLLIQLPVLLCGQR